MKRILVFITILAIAVCSLGCADASTMSKGAYNQSLSQSITAEQINAEVKDFVLGDGEANRRDRTSFTEKEHAAADYILQKLQNYGYADAFKQEAVAESYDGYTSTVTKEYKTYNVVAQFNPGKQKEIIICAGYDNLYNGLTELGVPSVSSEGIADNATGVGTLLVLAKAFAENNYALDFTVNFVFCGASKADNIGSRKFVSNYAGEINKILLCINLSTLVGDKLYLFADDVETKHEKLFITNGKEYSTKFTTLPNGLPVLPYKSSTDNLGYSHYGLIGDHAAFFNMGVPCINIFGGEYESFSYPAPILDTYESYSLKENLGVAAADAANLIKATVTAESFSVTAASFTKKTDYSFFTGDIFVYVVQLAIIVLAAVALLIAVKKLEKKFPFVQPKMPRVKIAVFGMEYEDKKDSDVFVDLKPVDPFENDVESSDKALGTSDENVDEKKEETDDKN